MADSTGSPDPGKSPEPNRPKSDSSLFWFAGSLLVFGCIVGYQCREYMASLEPRKQLIGTWEAAGGQPMRIQFTNQNRLIITRPGSMPKDIEFDSSYWKLSVGRHRVQVNKDSPGGPFYEDRWETVLDARLLSETELVLTFDKVKSDTDKYRFLEGRFSRIDYNKVRTHEDTIEPPR